MVMNMDAPDTTNRWIDDRLRALDPPDTWEPATGVALARFRERAAAARRAASPAQLRSRTDARGPGSRPPASHA